MKTAAGEHITKRPPHEEAAFGKVLATHYL